MPGLLVSVRSVEEAVTAHEGGAAVIDIKEPSRGPLGRADAAVWAAVRTRLADAVPLSVALGELAEWQPGTLTFDDLHGIQFCKMGLARAGSNWQQTFHQVMADAPSGPAWIAVVYADWRAASAPSPDAILTFAQRSGCAGTLVDTWLKGQPSALDGSWLPFVEKARSAGLLVSLAGGLDEAAMRRLAPLHPDFFAVRGAACANANRDGPIELDRVARLVQAVAPQAESLRKPAITPPRLSLRQSAR
jgi:uncharacterized protein (UPF0264 family)